MKIIMFLLFLALAIQIPHSVNAQSQNYSQTEFTVSGSLLFEYGYTSGGYGGNIKFLLPRRSNSNYITIAANYDRLKVSGFKNYYYNLITATAGYRKMVSNFYIEPQLGLGYFLSEDAALTFGPEFGLHKNNLTFSFNYRAAVMGFFLSDLIHIFSLKAGLRLSKK